MGQRRRRMPPGHRTHAVSVLDNRGVEDHVRDRGLGMVRAGAATSSRFTAIRGWVPGPGRLGIQCHNGLSGGVGGDCLIVLMARLGFHGLDDFCGLDRFGHACMVHMRGRRHGRGPVEDQGNAEEDAQEDRPGRHGGYFTLGPKGSGTGNVNWRMRLCEPHGAISALSAASPARRSYCSQPGQVGERGGCVRQLVALRRRALVLAGAVLHRHVPAVRAGNRATC